MIINWKNNENEIKAVVLLMIDSKNFNNVIMTQTVHSTESFFYETNTTQT